MSKDIKWILGLSASAGLITMVILGTIGWSLEDAVVEPTETVEEWCGGICKEHGISIVSENIGKYSDRRYCDCNYPPRRS